jgi:hypothetical protein
VWATRFHTHTNNRQNYSSVCLNCLCIWMLLTCYWLTFNDVPLLVLYRVGKFSIHREQIPCLVMNDMSCVGGDCIGCIALWLGRRWPLVNVQMMVVVVMMMMMIRATEIVVGATIK